MQSILGAVPPMARSTEANKKATHGAVKLAVLVGPRRQELSTIFSHTPVGIVDNHFLNFCAPRKSNDERGPPSEERLKNRALSRARVPSTRWTPL